MFMINLYVILSKMFLINIFRNTSTTSVLDFFFYCKVSEVDQVEKALRALVKKSQIGMFKLENTNATYEKSPGTYKAFSNILLR